MGMDAPVPLHWVAKDHYKARRAHGLSRHSTFGERFCVLLPTCVPSFLRHVVSSVVATFRSASHAAQPPHVALVHGHHLL